MEEVVVVKQLPIIEDQLNIIKASVIEKTSLATGLLCTEDTIKEVKEVRANLTKEYKQLEELRKRIKAQVLEPYESFEKVYKDCVSDPFTQADTDLKNKIAEVENGLKETKSLQVKSYFDEYCTSLNLDFITFEQIGLNITLSASLKSLKANVKSFVDNINRDIETIATMDNSDEILAEYKYNGYQLNNAIKSVAERVARVKAVNESKKEEPKKEPKEEPIKKTEEKLSAPVEVVAQETLYKIKFTVKGTAEQIKALKQFLKEGGYKYE